MPPRGRKPRAQKARVLRGRPVPDRALRLMQQAYSLLVGEAIRGWFAENTADVQDAADPSSRKRALALVEQAMRSIEASADEETKKLEQVMGARAVGGKKLLRQFRTRNVGLIRLAAEDTKKALDKTLEKHGGLHVEGLTKKLRQVAGVSERRAKFWAVDQTLKLNADIVRTQQQSLGIVEYIWRDSGDGTVRPRHHELDGTKQRYDDPPETGTGNHNPGEDYWCRCHADPVIPAIAGAKPESKRGRKPKPEPRRGRKPVAKPKPKPKPRPVAKPKPKPEPKPRPVAKPKPKPEPTTVKEGAAQMAKELSEALYSRDPKGVVLKSSVTRVAVESQLRQTYPKIARRHGLGAPVLKVMPRGADPMLDGTARAYHTWQGEVAVRQAVVQDAILALNSLRYEVTPNTESLQGLKTLIHEEFHGMSRTTATAYSGFGRFLEESGTELSAIRTTAEISGVKLPLTGYAPEIAAVGNAVQEILGGTRAEALELFQRAWASANFTDGESVFFPSEMFENVALHLTDDLGKRRQLTRKFEELDTLIRSGNFTLTDEGLKRK